jgi:ABC-type antimicrobial peptide transport system permease subunit
MKVAAPLLSVIALVAIGTAESLESARELAELPGRGRPTLGGGGAALTLAGLILSIGVYAVLGWSVSTWTGRESVALRIGGAVGVAAGLLGGTIRALAVRDYVDSTVSGFGLPVDLATFALVVFVALAVLVSTIGGGVITWLSFRSARKRSPRPRS